MNQEARVDLILTLGAASESIAVEANTPLLVTDSDTVGYVIENKAIRSGSWLNSTKPSVIVQRSRARLPQLHQNANH